MTATKKNRIFITLWLISVIFICIGSLVPVSQLPEETGLISDKFQHAFAYFMLTAFVFLSGATGRSRILLILLTLFLGIGIEFLQPLTGRHFEFADMVANSSGIVIAALVFTTFFNK